MTSFMTICAAKERECEDLKLRVAQLEFLYKEATKATKSIKKNKNKDKNMKCACGGVTSSIPSVAKTHEQTRIHQRSLCQFIDDVVEDYDSASVISVSGSEASVFDDDESVLVPNSEEFIRIKWHRYNELPEAAPMPTASYEEEEVEDVFEDAATKAPSKYNKARYEKSLQICSCGHKTSSIKSFAKRHEQTKRHQAFLLASVE